MRFDLRLLGRTESGRACVAEGSVYAGGEKGLQREAHKLATGGPWYYTDTSEAVPPTETITVENVEQIKSKRPNRDPRKR